jgi:hypothetical protein
MIFGIFSERGRRLKKAKKIGGSNIRNPQDCAPMVTSEKYASFDDGICCAMNEFWSQKDSEFKGDSKSALSPAPDISPPDEIK